jgi:hypothetical protein
MDKLKKYIEWLSGRKTGRVAYVINVLDLPRLLPGAEWQPDINFDLAAELDLDPALQDIFEEAIEKDPTRGVP